MEKKAQQEQENPNNQNPQTRQGIKSRMNLSWFGTQVGCDFQVSRSDFFRPALAYKSEWLCAGMSPALSLDSTLLAFY